MGEIRLLHTSDLHLDWLFANFSPKARATRRREILHTLDRIIDIACQEQVHGLLIAGDLFHSPNVDRHTLSMTVASFERLSSFNIPVLILPGNHDPLAPRGVYEWAEFSDNVVVFKDKDFETYEGIPGMTVYALPFWNEMAECRVLKDFKPVKREGYHVGILHGTYKNLPMMEENYYPIYDEDIALSGLDYLALGHYHNFLDCSVGKVKGYYPGSPSSLSFNNTSERKVILVKLNETGVEVNPIPLQSRSYQSLSFTLAGDNLTDLYRYLSRWTDLSSACVKLTVNGYVHQDTGFEPEKILEAYRDKFFYLEIEDRTRVIPRVTAMDNTIKGLFLKKIEEGLSRPNITEEERRILMYALYTGLTALEGGRL